MPISIRAAQGPPSSLEPQTLSSFQAGQKCSTSPHSGRLRVAQHLSAWGFESVPKKVRLAETTEPGVGTIKGESFLSAVCYTDEKNFQTAVSQH
jgi:hypothetical protein